MFFQQTPLSFEDLVPGSHIATIWRGTLPKFSNSRVQCGSISRGLLVGSSVVGFPGVCSDTVQNTCKNPRYPNRPLQNLHFGGVCSDTVEKPRVLATVSEQTPRETQPPRTELPCQNLAYKLYYKLRPSFLEDIPKTLATHLSLKGMVPAVSQRWLGQSPLLAPQSLRRQAEVVVRCHPRPCSVLARGLPNKGIKIPGLKMGKPYK